MTQVLNDLQLMALVASDICVGCNNELGEDVCTVAIKLKVATPDKTYPYIGLTICQECAKKQDYNQLKRGLNYWLNEGQINVLP